MKRLWKVALPSFILLILLFFGWESISAYLANHSYYASIFSTGSNWWIFLFGLFFSLIPLLYIKFAKQFTLKRFILLFVGSAAIFGLVHSLFKGGTVGFWRFMVMFNTVFLFALWAYLFTGFLSLWSFLNRKLIHFQQQRWQEIILSLWLGISVFLIIIQIFLGIGILFSWVSILLFIGLGAMIYLERSILKEYSCIILNVWITFREKLKSKNLWMTIIFILLLLSFLYIFYGLQNSFIPYSTAWDANHEYMYIPKILAENAGVYRWNTVGASIPGFWHLFITFCFSLCWLSDGLLGLSSDTIAVALNFWSGIMVLIFGVCLLFQVSTLFSKKKDEELPLAGISIWWMTLLLWLSSGMGAFLVIVDNKTDLWVMAFSLLALLGGMIFLGIFQEEKIKKSEIIKYLLIAGFFFGIASLAKVTAFVDLALFMIFLLGLWISPWAALGSGFIITGFLRLLNILTSSFMLSEQNAFWLIGIGTILLFFWIVLAIIKKRKIWRSFWYLLLLWGAFLAPLILFKLPWQITNQLVNDTFSIQQTLKSLLAKSTISNSQILLAQNDEENLPSLEEQNIIDSEILQSPLLSNWQDANSCLAMGNVYSEEELKDWLKEIKGWWLIEDFWRYIGFGWKEFKNDSAVYILAKLFWPSSKYCYGMNADAKLLCNHAEAIDSFDIQTLRKIYETEISDYNSQAAILLKEALDEFDEKVGNNTISFDIQEFRDSIVSLRQYYQAHSIQSNDWSLSIPYRYLVPLNIVFNWSLQNLSSYYTDIGFVWISFYIVLILSFIYALCKREQNLIVLSLTTLLWRMIWRVIGSAILWYWTVLISWTALSLLLFIDHIWKESNKKEWNPFALILIILLILLSSLQLVMNFMRISSQWAMGPFVRYKGNMGEISKITEQLEVKKEISYYNAKDVFDLQFPQYNSIINLLKDRKNDEWVIIAGTYIQYFLNNQWNLKMDWLLTDFWQKSSDGDLCKTYWRLKEDKTKYLIIDPNIWTVGMWEGNETLFHRFFAKLSAVDWSIEEDGTLVTLAKMYQLWYIKLLSTNNLWAYYAFNLSDAELREAFGVNGDENLLLLRAKLMGIRYFSEEVNTLFSQIWNLFVQRIMQGDGIQDIASMLGLEVNEKNIRSALSSISQWTSMGIESLSQDERMVLIQYYNIFQSFSTNNSDMGWQIVQSLLLNSVTGSSQVMLFELI